MSELGRGRRAALICRFVEPPLIAPDCSGELDARGRGGSSCADAELRTVGGGTATGIGERRRGLLECIHTS